MNNFFKDLPKMYKAVAAFISLLVPFLTAVVSAFSDGRVTSSEWTSIGIAFGALIVGTRTVYQVRNKQVGL